MKIRLIAAVTLLVICLGTAFFCMIHVNKCTRELEAGLQAAVAAAAVQSKDWAHATEQTQRIWARDKAFYHMIMPHSNLNELEWVLGAMPEFLARRDSALYIEQCVRGLQCIKTVREMERPTLGNVF